MKAIKVSEASGLVLDWLVAKCEGKNGILHDDGITRCIVIATPSGVYKGTFKPTINWAQGGPIIEREEISVVRLDDENVPDEGGFWQSVYRPVWGAVNERHSVEEVFGSQGDNFGSCYQVDKDAITGPTPLVAAMRCRVASKLGNLVEVPEELV